MRRVLRQRHRSHRETRPLRARAGEAYSVLPRYTATAATAGAALGALLAGGADLAARGTALAAALGAAVAAGIFGGAVAVAAEGLARTQCPAIWQVGVRRREDRQ